MGKIKIMLSEKTDKIVSKIVDEIGIKKTEYVKNLIIENLKKINFGENKK